MFGALNRFISRLDSDGPGAGGSDSYKAVGFQVLRNKNAEIPIEPWYDAIIGINGRAIDNPDPALFATEIRNCAGSVVALTCYSAKGQRTMSVDVHVPTPSPTLGLTLQWSPLSLLDQVWHILSVTPNSPADTAGLLPYSDYIVGTPEGHIQGEAGLGELVEEYISRQLGLWVFNHEYGVTRLVTITPSRSWGGNGALGCVLGFGALHRLPAPLSEGPVEGPGESLFEGARLSGEAGSRGLDGNTSMSDTPHEMSGYNIQDQNHLSGSNILIPASIISPPPLQSPGLISGPSILPKAAKKNKKAVSPGVALNEYFAEGEQKSKEEDFAPGIRADILPPPPSSSKVANMSPSQAETEDPKIDEAS